MMKFAAFENIVNALYVYVIPKPKSQCNKTEQLGVSFVAGYIAGVRTPVSWASFSILLEPAELHDWRFGGQEHVWSVPALQVARAMDGGEGHLLPW
jgi:hypothetical protein